MALGYLRSAQYELAQARCKVSRKGQAKVLGEKVLDGHWDWTLSISQTEVLATRLKAGEYVVECQTLPSGEQLEGRVTFRIVSVMSM